MFVLLCVFCSSDTSVVPAPEPLTLGGTWTLKEFGGLFDDYFQVLFPPGDARSSFTINNDRYLEDGKIFNTTFIDSGTVTEDVDSLRFYSQVLRRHFGGKLLDNALVLRKYMTRDYFGTALYIK